ncbi:hypothetical protein GQ43DRAFT_421270 [Delitschia confertaspora ATCC 74209]|uniref:AMMECR1 domain-containing protein n=1 Tax=Delitschia confertaspora ATCC 74209 TaxID=1513339 RepID=A0A9P4JGH9_9PLEO|nr:hypothetical protein GQ43DRAFT_421270 [Delitschia confertaspora ATCC 74209]
MATQAHCAYCFEVLSASLQKRKPLSLFEVGRLWKEYNDEPEDSQPTTIANGNEDEEVEDSDTEDAQDEDLAPRPAAISRLLAPSPSTTSSSSVSSGSTPNGLSEVSSATSKSSSRSSLPSPALKPKYSEKAQGEALGRHPLFITWNITTRSGNKNLRGCIGTFEPQELVDGLTSYALTAAFDDSRFAPISLRELPNLECGVTLLTNFEPVSDPMDWEIGIHGLRISFTYHYRRYGATYLPDVAREQGWTREETMVSLMRKAGWSGRSADWRKVGELEVIRYQGKKVNLSYGEWQEWRGWVEEQDE